MKQQMRIIITLLFLQSVGITAVLAQRSLLIDTQIGTHNSGQVHPGVSLPFGLSNAAVYRTPSNINHTLGVSLLNIQGTGCQMGALGHVIVRGSDQPIIRRDSSHAVWFGINEAGASLLDISYAGVRHQATATMRGVMHRIIGNVRTNYVVIDLGEGYTAPRNVSVTELTDSTIDASLEVGGFCTHPVYRRIYVHISVQGAVLSKTLDNTGTVITGRRTTDTVHVSVGLSLTSRENAKLNHQAELSGRTFTDVVASAKSAWESVLNDFQVAGGDSADSVMFYTALYRIMQHPSIAEDVNGEHVQFNSDLIDRDDSYLRTVGHDIWGIYQTNMPFYTLFLQEQWHNIMRSLVEMTIEAGETPQFDFLGKQIHIMGGDPFPMVVIDNYFKGFLIEEDVQRLLPILERASTTTGNIRPFQYLVKDHGYIPSDREDGSRRHNSVANMLEYATADAANAMVARGIGDIQRAAIFSAYSARIWNSFDGRSGWFRERTRAGDTVPGLDVDSYDGDYAPGTGGPGFKEGSVREFLFFPQHLRREIAQRLGGWDALAQRLDPIFEGGPRPFVVHNQIQMHLPFQYLYIPDSSHVAQRRVREALRSGFHVGTTGLPGNDDLGSVSAWAALVMMGLYPSTGFEGTWLVTAPVFDTIVAGNLTIIRAGERGPFVRRVVVDGKQVAQTHIDDAVLRKAREVVIETAANPQPQLRMWDRQRAYARWSNSGVTINVDDIHRQTPIEVSIGTRGSLIPIGTDTIKAGASTKFFADVPSELWWTLKDLGDPSGRQAVIRYTATRPDEPVMFRLVNPNPVYQDFQITDYNGLYPIRVVATNLMGQITELNTAAMPRVSTEVLSSGMYRIEATYPDGSVRSETMLVVR